MGSYKEKTFKDLTDKRKEKVRAAIKQGWEEGLTSVEISKKVRISPRSVAVAMGNLTKATC